MPLCAHFAHFELLPNSLPRAAASTAPNNLPPPPRIIISPRTTLHSRPNKHTHTSFFFSTPCDHQIGGARRSRRHRQVSESAPRSHGVPSRLQAVTDEAGTTQRWSSTHHPDLAVSFSTAGAWKRAEVWCFLSRFFPPLPLFSVSTDRISAAVN